MNIMAGSAKMILLKPFDGKLTLAVIKSARIETEMLSTNMRNKERTFMKPIEVILSGDIVKTLAKSAGTVGELGPPLKKRYPLLSVPVRDA
jgi:hypothetical protein